MKRVKVSVPRRWMYVTSAYVCLFLNAVGGGLSGAVCRFMYLFCFGTAVKDIVGGVKCLFRLNPDNKAVCSVVNVIAFTVLIVSFAVESRGIGEFIPACICSLTAVTCVSRRSAVFEALFFSVTVIFAAVAGMTAIVLSNSPLIGSEYAYCVLCAVGAARGLGANEKDCLEESSLLGMYLSS